MFLCPIFLYFFTETFCFDVFDQTIFLTFLTKLSFFYVFDETFFFYVFVETLLKLHLANFIWQKYGVDWLCQSIPWLRQVWHWLRQWYWFFSNGWTNKQTDIHTHAQLYYIYTELSCMPPLCILRYMCGLKTASDCSLTFDPFDLQQITSSFEDVYLK